jgi:cell division septation protein DedD
MHDRESTAAADALPAGRAGADREAAVAPLDGRQIFFLFIGSAVCACLVFAAGVVCGRRVERRAVAAAQTATLTDPLAVLDEIANAEEALTFHRALLDRPGPRPRQPGAGEASADAEIAAAARNKPFGPPKPRFTLQGPLTAKKPEAEALIRRLREAGYRPTLVEAVVDQKPQYRVQVGDFPSPEIAQSLKTELLGHYQLRAAITPF